MANCNCVSACEVPMVKLEKLLPFLTSQISQIPYEYGIFVLQQAYIEYASRTSLVVFSYSLNMQRDVYDYELTPPEGYRIYQIKSVGACGCCSYKPARPDYWFCCGYGFHYSNNRIVFSQKPSQDKNDAVTVEVILIPDTCVMEIPEFIAGPFGKIIADGALKEAFAVPNKPWTDLGQARLRERSFSIGIGRGKALALSGGQASNMHLRPVRWV